MTEEGSDDPQWGLQFMWECKGNAWSSALKLMMSQLGADGSYSEGRPAWVMLWWVFATDCQIRKKMIRPTTGSQPGEDKA